MLCKHRPIEWQLSFVFLSVIINYLRRSFSYGEKWKKGKITKIKDIYILECTKQKQKQKPYMQT